MTAFTTHLGLFEFNVLPFGMKNSPGEFQRMSDSIWSHLYNNGVKVYIDDIVIYDNDFDVLMERLDQVLEAAVYAGVYFKLVKCHLLPKEAPVLGHLLSREGIRCHPRRIKALRDRTTPKDRKELRSFVSSCSYLRAFIPHFAEYVHPLRHLLKKKSPFVWTATHQEAHNGLVKALEEMVALSPPRGNGPYLIFVDASNAAVGGCVLQLQEPREKNRDFTLELISFYSRCFTAAEQNWNTREREGYAIKYALEHNQDLVRGHKIYILMDHASLQWAKDSTQGKILR